MFLLQNNPLIAEVGILPIASVARVIMSIKGHQNRKRNFVKIGCAGLNITVGHLSFADQMQLMADHFC